MLINMDKKGFIAHWLLIIFLFVGLGIFFALFPKVNPSIGLKGEWQIDFLEKNFLEAERDKIATEKVARVILNGVLVSVANSGGSVVSTIVEEDSCGYKNGMPFWNRGKKRCFPELNDAVKTLFLEKMKTNFPDKNFNSVELTRNGLHVESDQVEITSEVGLYKYNLDFTIESSFFESQTQLFREVEELLSQCTPEGDLVTCLTANMASSWHHRSCVNEVPFPTNTREIVFCAQRGDIEHNFALDFDSAGALEVESISIVYNPVLNSYEIAFRQDAAVDSYNIYISDYPSLEDETGSSESIFTEEISDLGYVWKKFSFSQEDLEDNCFETKSKDQPYLCNEEVSYVVGRTSLETNKDPLVFTVTTVEDGLESDVEEWVVG